MDDRERLRQRFNRDFARWEIELPVDAMSSSKVWLIVQRGWTVWTRFDVDAEDGREHLDCYSMHRMTNDSHVRLYAGGEKENLPAIAETRASCSCHPARHEHRNYGASACGRTYQHPYS